jgi:hypothetical protein
LSLGLTDRCSIEGMREPFRLPIYVEPVLALVPSVEPEPAFVPQPEAAPTFFEWLDELYPEWAERPKTRGDCLKDQSAERPCPWVTCKHHLYIEISHRGLKDVDVASMKETCVTDLFEGQAAVVGDVEHRSRIGVPTVSRCARGTGLRDRTGVTCGQPLRLPERSEGGCRSVRGPLPRPA